MLYIWAILLGVGVVPLFGALIALGFGLYNDEFLPIFWSTIVIIPYPFCIAMFRRAQNSGRKKFNALAHQDGPPDRSHWCERTGIAINAQRKLIILCQGKALKKYVFSEVRGWAKKSMVGGGVIGTDAAATAHNIANVLHNKKNTSFEINVRDIDHPVWLIQMPREQDRNVWFEIFEQVLNEDAKLATLAVNR